MLHRVKIYKKKTTHHCTCIINKQNQWNILRATIIIRLMPCAVLYCWISKHPLPTQIQFIVHIIINKTQSKICKLNFWVNIAVLILSIVAPNTVLNIGKILPHTKSLSTSSGIILAFPWNKEWKVKVKIFTVNKTLKHLILYEKFLISMVQFNLKYYARHSNVLLMY